MGHPIDRKERAGMRIGTDRCIQAAATFLGDFRRDCGSWFLALAAYNAGPERIRGILARHAPGAVLSDSLYWAIREHLPAETRDFVPKFLGAVFVAAEPEEHGYEKPVARPFVSDRALEPRVHKWGDAAQPQLLCARTGRSRSNTPGERHEPQRRGHRRLAGTSLARV